MHGCEAAGEMSVSNRHQENFAGRRDLFILFQAAGAGRLLTTASRQIEM